MKLRYLLPPLLFLILWSSSARAQFTGGGTPVCNQVNTLTCSFTLPVGTLLAVNFAGIDFTSATIADNSAANVWHTASNSPCTTGSGKYIGYQWYTKVATASGFTVTVTLVGSSTLTLLFGYNFTGNSGSLPGDPIDVSVCDAFNSNSATKTSTAMVLKNHDAVTSLIVCASPNVGTTEFAPVVPLISSTGENAGSSSSVRSGHIVDNTTVGSQTFAWTSVQGCIFTTYNGVFMTAAFVSSGSGSYPMVIKERKGFGSLRKIPWDNRKRKLQIVSI